MFEGFVDGEIFFKCRTTNTIGKKNTDLFVGITN